MPNKIASQQFSLILNDHTLDFKLNLHNINNVLRESKDNNLLDEGSSHWLKGKLTRTVAPFSVSIIVACYGAPVPFVVLSGTPIITATFVDERKHAAVT